MAAILNALRGRTASDSGPPPAPVPKRLLVIDGDPTHNWYELFAGCTVPVEGGEPLPLEVDQAGWADLTLTAYSTGTPVVCEINAARRPIADSPQTRARMFKPDFVLIRNEFHGPGFDYRSKLLGFMYGQLGSVNSLQSILLASERPVSHAALIGVQRRLARELSEEQRAELGLAPGQDAFPLIEQTFYPTWQDMRITPSFPLALKVGDYEAGAGKALVMDHKRWEDMRSLMMASTDHCTAEPFVEGEYDIRLQRIGAHDRAFKRVGVGGSWKTQTTSAIVEELEVTPLYRLWLDEASQLFGGLDILSIDAVHAVDGSEYVLEINHTSTGLFNGDVYDEDVGYIREVVLARMAEHAALR